MPGGREDFEHTRERILRIAAGHFAARGFDHVSMRHIATACGLTPAALYYHFRDKSALYRETLTFVFGEKIAPLDAIVSRPAPARERLRELMRWFARLIARDQVFARLLHREMLDGDEARIGFLTREVFQLPFQRVSELIGEIMPGEGVERVALSAFSIILGHYEMLSIERHLLGPRFTERTPESIGEHAASMVLAAASPR